MASNQMSVLKAKIEKKLEGGFIVLVTNTELGVTGDDCA
jgi:hypothetical protein